MTSLTSDFIRKTIAHSDIIYQRGRRLFEHGGFLCNEADMDDGVFMYEVDGNHGDYTIRIELGADGVSAECDCPFPNPGCKHVVAVLLDMKNRLSAWRERREPAPTEAIPAEAMYLSESEIRQQALEDRRKRALSESLQLTVGDMYAGEHLVETPKGKQYVVTLHDPEKSLGHCTCPDFATSGLNTCKHMIHVHEQIKKKSDYKQRCASEIFPFVDVYWDPVAERVRLFNRRPASETRNMVDLLDRCFDKDGLFVSDDPADFVSFVEDVRDNKRIRIQSLAIERMDDIMGQKQLRAMMEQHPDIALDKINTALYPYQREGVRFGLYRRGLLIGDEMGLGKTLQAIALSVLKKEVFGFRSVLVITLASLKEQWRREIERFSDENATVIAGSAFKRREVYENDDSYFKITNYEAVLRDVTVIRRTRPDIVILDEAQRIKNFTTKTAEAVKSLPREHAIVLTGTALENKLEDVYSIIQFLEPRHLAPLWRFAADHLLLSRQKKGCILGYRNLNRLSEKLQPIVIRRRKEEVLMDLPDVLTNTYYLDLSREQAEMHAAYGRSLMPLLTKKFLTPMDQRRIQELLLCMRRVCDSTYLIDRSTNLSPKLRELESILDELVIQNGRKVVIFSEWTTMTFLIARQLSDSGIKFVELTGKIPVNKRQALIDEFSGNPECRVFLSTDAGGTGLNLQAADCVINFEPPWNPSRLNQRIGRVNRIGQASKCVNVVNLISKFSIEEKILAGIRLKSDVFEGVFDGGKDRVDFSAAKRNELLNQLRGMMGEDPALPMAEAHDPEAIPEDTPHFLNPKVLEQEAESRIDYDGEETVEHVEPAAAASDESVPASCGAAVLAKQPPEKVEAVLNSGMQFLGGLLEMATGQGMVASGEDGRMIHIDRTTGEVTMKFRLPGF